MALRSTYHPMKRMLIAPCGMNCAVCSAHLRAKNQCPGCRSSSAEMPAYCSICIMRNCRVIVASGGRCGSSCPEFPCKRLRQLDARYRTRYGISLIGNLQSIERKGINAFLRGEAQRWRCTQCDAILSIHRPACLVCGKPTGVQ